MISWYEKVFAARVLDPAAALAVASLLSCWLLSAAALDREAAIEAAKRQVKGKCATASPCRFSARMEQDKWFVRVEFPGGGHAIFILNQSGKIVGRVE
jgi:hypothetical protein